MNDEEREIDLKILFAYVFKQWRKILLIAVLFGLLGAGYKCVKILPTYNSLQTKYTQSMQSYENNKASITAEKQKTQDYIDYLTEYSKNSVKASIDPYNEARTELSWSIVTSTGHDDFEALLNGTNHADQITQAYVSYINSSVDYSSLASSLGIDKKILLELITVKGDYTINTVTVTVIGTSEEQTKKIADYISSQVAKNTSSIQEKYGDHTLVENKAATSTITDSGLVTTINDKMLSPNATMNDLLTKINTLQTTLASQQKSLSALSAPTAVSTTVEKDITKYLMLGFVGGLAGMIVLLAVIEVLSGKLLSEDDLSSGDGIKTLGIMPMKSSKKKLNKFDRCMLRRIDSSFGSSAEVSLAKTAANITACAEGKKTLILVSGNMKQNVADLQASLQAINPEIQYLASSNIDANADELNKLGKADGVILVAERNVTKLSQLSKAAESVKNWKKPIVGSIIL
ncbi:MAG: Wzz/FepE/Etk N-terminal domain-containing protein [Solobacterium sp.]|jgi:capsular polysaccharide biosynthesis protein|nr:Wzz/FepE/Etk N-terminal domain-containing protein [Solobacterium sp.]